MTEPNHETKKCGVSIDGPIVKDRGRSRPLWRSQCRRKTTNSNGRCWQHQPKEN